MSYKLIDLRPNRNLLDVNFESYVLSLEPTPVLKKELKIKPAEKTPSDEQYSFLHARMFGLQNHLVKDPWTNSTSSEATAYFVNEDLHVSKVTYNFLTGFEEIIIIFKIPIIRLPQLGDYNVTIKFVSENICLLSNLQNLLIIETGDRSNNTDWKLEESLSIEEISSGFIIQDGRIDIRNGQEEINVLLQNITNTESKFYANLTWITFIKNSETKSWNQTSCKNLKSQGSIFYSALDPNCKGITIASDKLFKFSFDSVNPVCDEETVNPKFEWSQQDKSVIIKFNIEEKTDKKDYEVKLDNKFLTVSYKDEILLNGELYDDISESQLEEYGVDKLFRLILSKEKNSVWPHLISNCPPETFEIDKLPNTLQESVNSLETQLEECDFSVNDTEYFIEHLDAYTHKVTHRVNLGNVAPLFNVTIEKGFPDAIVLRSDVDATIWILEIDPLDLTKWNLRHEGTLNAIGYVQASKQQRKFTSCAPNMSYTIISESKRHIFLYMNNHPNASGLKNRNGHKFSFGQQKLVTLDNTGDVLGIVAENNVTLILTEKYVICLQINNE